MQGNAQTAPSRSAGATTAFATCTASIVSSGMMQRLPRRASAFPNSRHPRVLQPRRAQRPATRVPTAAGAPSPPPSQRSEAPFALSLSIRFLECVLPFTRAAPLTHVTRERARVSVPCRIMCSFPSFRSKTWSTDTSHFSRLIACCNAIIRLYHARATGAGLTSLMVATQIRSSQAS